MAGDSVMEGCQAENGGEAKGCRTDQEEAGVLEGAGEEGAFERRVVKFAVRISDLDVGRGTGREEASAPCMLGDVIHKVRGGLTISRVREFHMATMWKMKV